MSRFSSRSPVRPFRRSAACRADDIDESELSSWDDSNEVCRRPCQKWLDLCCRSGQAPESVELLDSFCAVNQQVIFNSCLAYSFTHKTSAQWNGWTDVSHNAVGGRRSLSGLFLRFIFQTQQATLKATQSQLCLGGKQNAEGPYLSMSSRDLLNPWILFPQRKWHFGVL